MGHNFKREPVNKMVVETEDETLFRPVSISYFGLFRRRRDLLPPITAWLSVVTVMCVEKDTPCRLHYTHTTTPTPYLSTLASQYLPCPFQTRQHDNQPFSPRPPTSPVLSPLLIGSVFCFWFKFWERFFTGRFNLSAPAVSNLAITRILTHGLPFLRMTFSYEM